MIVLRSTFWRILQMPLINCEITLHLEWSKDCTPFFINNQKVKESPRKSLIC